VTADGPRLKRVLANLVTSARKHVAVAGPTTSHGGGNHGGNHGSSSNNSGGGGGQVLIRVGFVQSGAHLGIVNSATSSSSSNDHHHLAQKPWLRFEVHDNGGGVPVNLRPKLFVDPCVTASSSHSNTWQSAASPPPSDPRAGAPELDESVPTPQPATTAAGAVAVGMSTGGSGESLNEDCGRSGNGGAATAARRSSAPSSSSSSSNVCGSAREQKKQGFAARQGSGLGLFVANLCAQEMGGTCGFACERDGHGGAASTAATAAATERSLRAPVNRNAPPPPPTPRLGGSVFWVDVPFVPAAAAAAGVDGEGVRHVSSELRTLRHVGSSESLGGMGADAAVASAALAAAGVGRAAQTENAAIRAAAAVVSRVSGGSGTEVHADGSNSVRRGEEVEEEESTTTTSIETSSTNSNENSGPEWCKVCSLSDEDFNSSVVSVTEAAAAVAAKLSDEDSLSSSGGSLPHEKAYNNLNGWGQHAGPGTAITTANGSPASARVLLPSPREEVPRTFGRHTTAGGGGVPNADGGGRVLVVDDSVMVKKLLCRALQQNNFSVDTAANGREGLVKMQNDGPYCAVLMDFLMPVLDGIAVRVNG